MRPVHVSVLTIVTSCLVGLAAPAWATPVEVSWLATGTHVHGGFEVWAAGDLGTFDVVTGNEQFALPNADPDLVARLGAPAIFWWSHVPLVANTGVALQFTSMTTARFVDITGTGDGKRYFGAPSATARLMIDPGVIDLAIGFTGTSQDPVASGEVTYSGGVTYNLTLIPEPSTALLLGAGLLALGARGRRRERSTERT